MNDFQIIYEITKPDYAEANALLLGRKIRVSCWEMWVFWGAGALLLLLPLSYREPDKAMAYPVLVVPFAVFLFYHGLLYLFPAWNVRRWYQYSGLANRSFTARFSPEAVKVAGANVEWVHEWASYKLIKESSRIFLFYDGMTMFIFAKRYFTPDQVSGLQQLIKVHGKSAAASSA